MPQSLTIACCGAFQQTRYSGHDVLDKLGFNVKTPPRFKRVEIMHLILSTSFISSKLDVNSMSKSYTTIHPLTMLSMTKIQ